MDVIFNNNANQIERLKNGDKDYLSKIENNEYEFLAFSGHGSQSQHQFDIQWEDIKRVKPKIYFGIFTSCSLGDYSTENNIGGWYLFGGNGLVMFLRTFPSIGSIPNIQSLYIVVDQGKLGTGATFGDAYKYQVGNDGWQAISLQGDPTLKLRYT
jgi:hypothetical protein